MGPQVNALDAQRQQGQQDADRFLLIPRQHQRQRQVIDGALESIRQCQRDPHGAVGVVALAHIQNPGDSVDIAQIQIVEAVFAAGQRQDQRVHRRGLDEVRVVVASGVRTVAAAYQKDVLHRAAFDGVDHRRGAVAQHSLVGKAGGQDMSAVDATHAPVGAVSAQGQRLVDEGGEILAALPILRDVLQSGIAHHRRGIDTVGIAGTGRHDAVGGHQNGCGKAVELALLVLPGGAEVSGQLRVFSQPRIPVGGQHLAVGVHVDPVPVVCSSSWCRSSRSWPETTMNGPDGCPCGPLRAPGHRRWRCWPCPAGPCIDSLPDQIP